MVACNVGGMLLYKLLLKEYYFELYPALVLFMFAISAIVVSVTAKAIEGDNATFVNISMVTSMLKLLLLALVFLLYAWLVNTQLISFFVSLVVLYVVFTVFETAFRAKLNNRHQNELNQK
jgi:hypothetical protein